MCIIIFAWKVHPSYPLILIANRDEFYDRDTLPAARWVDNASIIAGRDGERDGTWGGITDQGRVAGLTNFRDGKAYDGFPRSRGQLTVDFLQGTCGAEEYLMTIEEEYYGGYTLLVGTVKEGLWWASNHAEGIHKIEPGIHGLANHLMDTNWPKVQEGKEEMESLLQRDIDEDTLTENLFQILMSDKQAADEDLPDTGLEWELEKLLSSLFVSTPTYGTRSSTVILARTSGEIRFIERSFGPERKLIQEVEYLVKETGKL